MGTNVHSSKKAGILPVAKNHFDTDYLNINISPLNLKRYIRIHYGTCKAKLIFCEKIDNSNWR